MTRPTAAVLHRTGAAAVAAGVFLFLGVGPELLWPVQRPDGSVTDMALFALYVTCWTIGAAALAVALLGLDRVGPGPLPRAGRIGRGLGLAGAVLLVAFGLVGLVTALLGGAPAEWSFLLFAVGLLLVIVGSVPLGLGLRRAGGPAVWWIAVLVAGAGGLAALGASADPWHDLGMFLYDAAWVAFGLRLLAAPAEVREHVSPLG